MKFYEIMPDGELSPIPNDEKLTICRAANNSGWVQIHEGKIVNFLHNNEVAFLREPGDVNVGK